MTRRSSTGNPPASDAGGLFIVDNAPGGRSCHEYLRQWCEIAAGIDVATGYFDIGALLDLDGDWQRVDSIRILMGDEVSGRTKAKILEGIRQRAEAELEASLDAEKAGDNPFLTGVDAIVKAIRSGQIECKVYNRDKFHAKAYITHGRIEAVGSQALVGSSNFTRPGLNQNIELNIKVESGPEVAQLQRWYEQHWKDSVEVTEGVLKIIERHVREFTPFEIYARALQELFRDVEPAELDWEQNQSQMFGKLDRYQQEAYWAMVDIARKQGGALLCDGVGLGKTFVGLMLIERLVMRERKRVVLFAPKGAKVSVWEPALKKHLAHVGGWDGTADFSNLSVFSHTDLMRVSPYPERFARITELADAVVVDEAHHFRNRGKRGDAAKPDERSRYYRLFDLINPPGSSESKVVYLLTATPINNALTDFKHLVELFTGGDDAAFRHTLGVPSVAGRINTLTKDLQEIIGDGLVGDNVQTATDLLLEDRLFEGLVVQRSRAYAKESQRQQGGTEVVFPDRMPPTVAGYSIRKSYGALLDRMEKAFERDKPLFALSIYYPLAFYIGSDDIDPLEQNRQQQVVGLIRTNFLKRFESSVYAFEQSCSRLIKKLLAFVTVHAQSANEKRRLERWLAQHSDELDAAAARQLALWGDEAEESDDEDIVPAELLDGVEELARTDYDVDAILDEAYLDMDELSRFLAEAQKFTAKQDDKLKKLIRLLKSKDLDGRKVLIFTEFADTARYLKRQLDEAGISGLAQVDSGSKGNRDALLKRFAPYYNDSSSRELSESGEDEIRVLIATDILSEGLNLQDATRLINYDIHWNPVRLMQRIGRVDRRLDPEIERAIVADHPEVAGDRGTVAYWNFLPPDELRSLLTLYERVAHKTLMISETLGIEGGKLLSPDDDYRVLREFNEQYEGAQSPMEQLQTAFNGMITNDEGLLDALRDVPVGAFSGRAAHPDGIPGIFFCFRLPAFDNDAGAYSLEAGTTRWYFRDASGGITDDAPAIDAWIASDPGTPRNCVTPHDELIAARAEVRRHVRNTYERQVELPADAPSPQLVCWMEVTGG